MRSTTFRVVIDANALFPNTLRDTLLRAAAAGLYQVHWSAQVLEEARRNLVLKGIMSEDKSRRLMEQMQRAFPEALITGYEGLISSMGTTRATGTSPRQRFSPARRSSSPRT